MEYANLTLIILSTAYVNLVGLNSRTMISLNVVGIEVVVSNMIGMRDGGEVGFGIGS